VSVVVALVTLGTLALNEWKDQPTANSESTTAVTTTPPSKSTTTAVTTPPPGYISESTWTDGQWPFTVPEGVLICTNPGWQMTLIANGVTYAVNLTAGFGGRYADITAIRRDDPDIPGTKVDMRPVIRRGFALCEQ
ncbi:MAG: DUF2511 domain-containing protein, partial [Mycobacterium sp.]